MSERIRHCAVKICTNTKRKSNIGGCGGFFRRTPEEVGKQQRFAYIHEHAEKAELALYCRVLCVSVQGYKKHVQSLIKPYKYTFLLASIKAILAEDIFNKNYGKRRMYEKRQLDYDCAYSYNTVAKVLRDHGLLHERNRPKGLTKADKLAQKADNLLNRDFSATAPDQKVVCYDNMCLGVALADNMRTELCIQTYQQAAEHHDLRGAIAHSDRGSQYTSEIFRQTLASMGIIQSMNSAAGRCHDNAKCKSMWARGKNEVMACYDVKRMTCQQLKQVLGLRHPRKFCVNVFSLQTKNKLK